MGKLPKRTRTHVLEEESKQFVRQTLPAEWIVESGEKDYGIDLVTEIVRGECITGAHFLIQLKATDKMKVRQKGYIAHVCKTITLRYFLQRPELVVYIVYDAQEQEGYWIWIQDYVRNNLDPAWKSQKTATIQIPLENKFNQGSVGEIAQRVLKSHQQAIWLAAVQTAENPFFDYNLEVTDDEVRIGVSTKYPGALEDHPVTIGGIFKFDQSQEGQAAKQALEAAIKSGAPAEIDSRFFEGFGMPDFASNLLAHSEDEFTTKKIILGPAVTERRLIVKISVLDQDSQPLTEIPYIDFRVVQAGTEEITYSNEEQNIPLKVRWRINFEHDTSSISLQYRLLGLNMVQVRNILTSQRALANGSWFQITDLNTERSVTERIKPGSFPEPNKDLVWMVSSLAYIQERTNQLIYWTGQVTKTEIQILNQLLQIMRTGQVWEKRKALHFRVGKTEARDLADAFANNEQIQLRFHSSDNSITLLGTELPLGPATALVPGAKPREGTLERFQELDRLPDDAAVQIDVEVGEPGVIVFYHDWLPNKFSKSRIEVKNGLE